MTADGKLPVGDHPLRNPISILIVKALSILDQVGHDVRLFRETPEWFDIYGRLDPSRFAGEARRLEDKLSQVAVPLSTSVRLEDEEEEDQGIFMEMGILRAVRALDHHSQDYFSLILHPSWRVRAWVWIRNGYWTVDYWFRFSKWTKFLPKVRLGNRNPEKESRTKSLGWTWESTGSLGRAFLIPFQ